MKIQHTVLFLCILFFAPVLPAQVGINTTNPDPSAALHINHNMKGVLLPVVDEANRATMVSNGTNVGDGMLVYDDVDDVFYFWDKTNNRWQVLNPWRSTRETSGQWSDVRLDDSYAGRNVYVGASTAPAAAKLHVEGTLRVESAAEVDGAVTAKNGMTVTGNTDVSGTLTANTVVGYGTIPVGGIIMWSGTTAPDGWALCNGANGTPDLRGRFVVGYDPGKSSGPYTATDLTENYGNIGNKGGKTGVQLAGKEQGQISFRFRRGRADTDANDGDGIEAMTVNGVDLWCHRANLEYGGSWNTTDNWTSTKNIDALAAGQAHENRPPYYVLAYIIRIK